MDEFRVKREKMIAEQIVERGIKDSKVIDAIRKVERHLFISDNDRQKAYDDTPIQIDCSQTISQPYIVALMTELLELTGDEIVLEIGTGTGYQTAILAEIARFVYSIERHPSLAENARILLGDLGYSNIEIFITDGSIGLAEKAPYDAILVSAAAPYVPDELVAQLSDHRNLVIPVGSQRQQRLIVVSKRGDSYIQKSICGCIFVPLIGQKGWNR